MRGGSSTVRLEMEHHNFDDETNEEIERDAHGLCVMSDGCETLYQPWGAHGRPLTNPLLSAFNVSVWLLYKMTGHDLSTNAILEVILRLPLPSDVAGHMFLFALRQQHCLPRYEAMFYLKGWCYRCGLAQPGEVQTPAETMVSRTSLVLVRPTLASALVHLGFPRCFAVHLPNSIGAGNRTLWRGNWVLVPVCKSALREVHVLKKSPPTKTNKVIFTTCMLQAGQYVLEHQSCFSAWTTRLSCSFWCCGVCWTEHGDACREELLLQDGLYVWKLVTVVEFGAMIFGHCREATFKAMKRARDV